MTVQVLEADERSVRLSSLQTGCRERSPQTPQRDSLLVFMKKSALIDGSILRDLQATFTLFLRPLWTWNPRSMIHEPWRCPLTRPSLRSKTIRHDSDKMIAPRLIRRRSRGQPSAFRSFLQKILLAQINKSEVKPSPGTLSVPRAMLFMC